MKTISMTEFRRHFGKTLAQVQRVHTIGITRCGQIDVVLVSIQWWEEHQELLRKRRRERRESRRTAATKGERDA